MLKFLILYCLAAVNAQDNRPWPIGSGPPQQLGPAGPNQGPSFSGGTPWQTNNNQPVAGGQFGQNLPGQNSQQGWLAGSNPQFVGPQGQPQHPSGLQAVPANNPPPGTVTGADRAVLSGSGSSNPQWGNPQNPGAPQWGNPGQPNWQPQGQPGQPGQPLWNNQPGQPGPGQPLWNSNNDPRFGPNSLGGPNNPQNPNQPLWAQNQQTQSTPPYPIQGRPYAGAPTSKEFSYSLLSLMAILCLTRLFV